MTPTYSVIDIDCHHLILPKGLMPVGTYLVLTADPEHCLLIFERDIWEPIRDKLLSLSGNPAIVGKLKSLLVGNSRDVSVDSQYRLEIAPELAEFAGLDKIVYWVQTGHHVELWSPEAFSKADGGSWLNKQLIKKNEREQLESSTDRSAGIKD